MCLLLQLCKLSRDCKAVEYLIVPALLWANNLFPAYAAVQRDFGAAKEPGGHGQPVREDQDIQLQGYAHER
jgi:hypothetical protein